MNATPALYGKYYSRPLERSEEIPGYWKRAIADLDAEATLHARPRLARHRLRDLPLGRHAGPGRARADGPSVRRARARAVGLGAGREPAAGARPPRPGGRGRTGGARAHRAAHGRRRRGAAHGPRDRPVVVDPRRRSLADLRRFGDPRLRPGEEVRHHDSGPIAIPRRRRPLESRGRRSVTASGRSDAGRRSRADRPGEGQHVADGRRR